MDQPEEACAHVRNPWELLLRGGGTAVEGDGSVDRVEEFLGTLKRTGFTCRRADTEPWGLGAWFTNSWNLRVRMLERCV